MLTTKGNPICNICCETTKKQYIISSNNYEGFNLLGDSISIRRAGIKIRMQTFSLLTESDIENIENEVRKQYDSFFKNLVSDTTVTYGTFRNYVRQYIGGTNHKGEKIAILSFNYQPFLENFCQEHYKYFQTQIVRRHYQRQGFDFVVLYNYDNKSFDSPL